MKTVQLYELADITKEIQEKVIAHLTEEEVEFQLQILSNESDSMTPEAYWKEIGCSQSYGESTSWFIPSVYYEHHKEAVDEAVKAHAASNVYTKNGATVYNFATI